MSTNGEIEQHLAEELGFADTTERRKKDIGKPASTMIFCQLCSTEVEQKTDNKCSHCGGSLE